MAINQQAQPALGQGVAESLQKNLFDPEQQRQQTKLQLAIQSMRIQAEEESRMREAQFNSQLGGFTGPQMQGVAGLFGAPPEQVNQLGGLFPNGVGAEQGKGILGALGMGNRVPTTMVHSVGPNGESIVTPFRQGRQTGTGVSVGLSPEAANKVTTAKTAFNNGMGFVKNLKDTVGGFLGAKDATGLPAQYTKLKLNQILQNNPQAKAYFDGLTAQALTAEKDMTGTAREASSIISGFSKSLPQMSDTAPTAFAKIDQLANRVNRGKAAVYKTYKIPLEPEDTATQGPTVNPNDPLGIR